jgi:histidinol dehydrogenase
VAGVDEVYRVGGSQAVAALAYGSGTIEPVDVIAGPGNIFVTLAKRAVFGRVGIDGLPGPSEVVVIADGSADAGAVAADLLAQAEHNPGASILLTPDEAFCREVLNALAAQLQQLSRAESTRTCLERYSMAVICSSMEECIALSDTVAPEHLQISTRDSHEVAGRVRHAGAIFIGSWTPVACGDYIAGPSHTLPTSRTARFSSGLSANTFRKRSSLVSYERTALAEDAGDIERMALAEGLDAHARSVRIRLQQESNDS